MKTEAADSEQTIDLGANLSRRRCAGDHFLEISHRAGEIPRRTPRPAALAQQGNAWPILIRCLEVIQEAERPAQIVGGFLVTKTLCRTLCCLAEIAECVGKIATVLKMQGERRRDVCRPIAIPIS